MNKEYSFEEIEEYLSGTLLAEEKSRFEDALRNDPALTDAVEKHRSAHALVEQYTVSRISEKVKAIHQQEKNRVTAPEVSWIKIAAAVLVLCVAGIYFYLNREYSSDRLYTAAFELYPNRFSTMGSIEENVFAEAMKNYDNHEYGLAIEKFSSIDPQSEYRLPANLYAGVSQLALEHPDAAIKILLPLSENITEYSEASSWYLALAYLKKGDEENAKKWLTLITQSGGYRSKQAGELLTNLNSVWKKLPGI